MTGPFGRERTPGPIEEVIVDFALRGYTASQIAKELPAAAGKLGMKAPSLRTIQRIVSRAKPPDRSGPWQIEESSPDDAREVLDFIAQMTLETKGDMWWVSRQEATWIARLRRLSPQLASEDVSFLTTLRLVYTYISRREIGESTRDLDAFLAFAPWEGLGATERYVDAVEKQYVSPPPYVAIAIIADYLSDKELPGRLDDEVMWRKLGASLQKLKADLTNADKGGPR